MTSFAAAIEPAASPRLAAAALLVHIVAGTTPWLARVDAPLATLLSLAAIAGLVLTVCRLPGRHCTLSALDLDAGGDCHARLLQSGDWICAKLGAGSRAYPSLAIVDIQVGGRRYGWVLPRAALPPGEFRRLKARIRLTC